MLLISHVWLLHRPSLGMLGKVLAWLCCLHVKKLSPVPLIPEEAMNWDELGHAGVYWDVLGSAGTCWDEQG